MTIPNDDEALKKKIVTLQNQIYDKNAQLEQKEKEIVNVGF